MNQANTLSKVPIIRFAVSITSAAAPFKALDCCKLVSACVDGGLSGFAICEASCDSSCCAVESADNPLLVAGSDGKALLIVFMRSLSAGSEETVAHSDRFVRNMENRGAASAPDRYVKVSPILADCP